MGLPGRGFPDAGTGYRFRTAFAHSELGCRVFLDQHLEATGGVPDRTSHPFVPADPPEEHGRQASNGIGGKNF
jgi:hypothetical protein